MSPNAITEYLSLFVHDNPVTIELLLKIDKTIYAEIHQKKLVSKVILSIAPKRLTDDDYLLGESLCSAIGILKPSDADRSEITIATQKKHGLNFKLLNLSKWVDRLRGGDDSPINIARATAREDTDDRPEVLDLLQHRITSKPTWHPDLTNDTPARIGGMQFVVLTIIGNT